MDRRGGPKVVFILFLFFSGLLHSPVLYIVYIFEKSVSLQSSKRVSPSHVIHTIPGFHESAISMFILSKIIRFYTI